MNQEHTSVREMWKDYLKSIGEADEYSKCTSWHFCDNEKDANALAELVKQGIKRATTGLYYFYELEKEPLPKVGDLSIILNWQGIAQCIIKTNKVTLLPFKEVTKEYAEIEGEGDKSLKYWREAHINAFNRSLEKQMKKFNEDMLVVCEEFEMLYK